MANAPVCLTSEYIQSALRTSLKAPDLNVKSIDIQTVGSAGDNFIGQLYRLIVHLDNQTMSIVAKYTPKKTLVDSDNPTSFDVYQVEAKYFRTNIPLYKETVEDFNIAPQSLHIDDENRLILMEDLAEKGFELSRTELLEKKQCVLVFEALAVLHGASYKAIQKQPDLKNTRKSPYRGERVEPLVKFYRNAKANLDKSAHKFHLSPTHYEQLFGFLEKFEKTWFTVCDKQEGKLNFIIHGDLWLKNLMFRYCNKSATAEEVKILDFQISNYNSFANDLQYLLFTSAHLDVILNDIDFLLMTYFQKLSKIAPDIPDLTFERIKSEFAERYYFGFLLTLGFRSEKLDWGAIMEDKFVDIGLGDDERVEEFHKLMSFFDQVANF